MTKKIEITYDWLMSNIDISAGPGGCHPWIGSKYVQGYGRIGRRGIYPHRWLLGYLRGTPLDPDEHALHHCDNPACCNPEHLYVGTHQDNMRDVAERKRARCARVTHCPSGHEYAGENLYVHNGRRHCRTCRREQKRTAA